MSMTGSRVTFLVDQRYEGNGSSGTGAGGHCVGSNRGRVGEGRASSASQQALAAPNLEFDMTEGYVALLPSAGR